MKAFVNRGEEPRLHFWRMSAGVEVDLVAEDGIEEHYKLLSLPIAGVILNPRLDLERCAA